MEKGDQGRSGGLFVIFVRKRSTLLEISNRKQDF